MCKTFNYISKYIFVVIVFMIAGNRSVAEGTKDLNPNPGDNGLLQIWDNGSALRNFMTYEADENSRLYISVADPSETIYMGFRQNNNDVYFRVRDPLGNIVYDNGAGGGVLVPNAGAGFINDYNEAVAGPNTIDPTGYDPIAINPTVAGDYYIEFNARDPLQVAGNRVKRVFTYFDITVADASNQALEGRLWSRQWDINMMGGANRFNGTMYIYANDGIITSLDFNGIQPYGFTIAANSTGLTNTGNPTDDRESRAGNVNFPEYRIFLNYPDTTEFPVGTFGQLTQTSSITGCTDQNRCINIFVDKAGNVEVLLDLNGTPGYQQNTEDRILSATVDVGQNCIPWDALDGLGNPVASGTTIDMEVNFFNGLTHLPLYDVENHENGYIVELAAPPGANPDLFWDDSRLPGGTTELNGCPTPPGCHTWTGNFGNERTINTWWYANIETDQLQYTIGDPIIVDANANNGIGVSAGTNDTIVCLQSNQFELNGYVQVASGIQWSSTGTGSFDNDTALNATYTLSGDDISNGGVTITATSTGNGLCPAVVDSMEVTTVTTPSADAGPDQFVCANNSDVTLAGTVTNAGGSVWTGNGGTFSNPNDLNAVYSPSQAEINVGVTSVVLSTTGTASCPAATDTMLIIFSPAPTVNAGPDIDVCENTNASLSGTISNATSPSWSGGSGTFLNSGNLNTTYFPNATDYNNGFVELYLTAGRASCLPVTDTIRINFTPEPDVNAGSDQLNVCSNTDVSLNGSVTIASGGVWSNGGGNFSDPNDLNATYTPSAGEIAADESILILTSTGNGTCNAISDTVRITYKESPQVNVGSRQLVCQNNITVDLFAAITGANGGKWSGGNGTYVPNSNQLNGTYIPSQDEIDAGFLQLILTSVGNGNCNAAVDTLDITIVQEPTVSIGGDFSVCENNPTATIIANTTNSNGGSWSGGTGTFSDPNNDTTDYTLSASEISAGTVNLTYTATSVANCNPVSGTVNISVTDAPEVDAGQNQTICENNADISLSGSVINANGGVWSGGAGTYSPDANSLNAVYTPTASEIANGSILLTLTSTGNDDCNAVSDQVIVNFSTAPVADAGPNQTICANTDLIINGAVLSGSVTTATGASWTSTGTGVFAPNSFIENPTYVPSSQDTTNGSVDIILRTTGNGNCNPAYDTMNISFTPAPVVNAGPNQTVCVDNPQTALSGTVTVATGGQWTGGAGLFNPDRNTLNTVYTPTNAEQTNGSVTLTLVSTGNGTCNPETDDITITITPPPSVDAGPDQTVCGDVASIPLNGSVTIAGGGQWSSSGSGTFSDASSLSSDYIPSAADKGLDSLILTLTSTNNGTCNPTSDQMVIRFQDLPVIDAGPDETICTNEFPIQLQASGSSSQWSGGNGTFSPNSTSLNATYTPGATEISNGTVTLTASTIANGSCPSISDDVTFTIPQGPVVDAGTDQTVCADIVRIPLNGSFSNAGGINWSSSGSGIFETSPGLPDADYVLSSTDISNGSVELFIETVNNGVCNPSYDTVEFIITPAVEVFPGPDQIVCADQPTVNMNGVVINAGGGFWSTTGSGTFSDSTNLNTTYTFSSADVNNGSVDFELTTTNNGFCNPVSGNLTVNITPLPEANAGSDSSVCADISEFQLNGSVTNATGGIWSTTGTGSFFANETELNARYVPSATDLSNGSVALILTTSGVGSCNPVSDTMTLSFTPVPAVSVGTDITICADQPDINLSATVSNATGVYWQSSGSGVFNDSTIVNPVYNLSSADSLNGTFSIRATSTGNGSCQAVSDQLIVNVNPVPQVNAGNDQILCAEATSIGLNGTVQVATGGQWSTTGSGVFNPDDATLNASYGPTAGDISAGSLQFILTSTGNGLCNAVVDTMLVTFDPVPVVNAGNDSLICADVNSIPLSGSILNASQGLWTTTSNGTFSPDNSDLNGNYQITDNDRSNGQVEIVLSSSGGTACASVSDTVIYSIAPVPVVDAGSDQLLCASTDTVNISGSVINAGGGYWSSDGTGVFITDTLNLNSAYVLSSADKSGGNVVFTLSSRDAGTCNRVFDNVNVSVEQIPVVNAGRNQTICADLDSVAVNGSLVSSPGSLWSTLGGGSFTNDTLASTHYNLSDSDKSAGFVDLILTSTGTQVCNSVFDTVRFSINPAPIVNAGINDTICQDLGAYSLNGIVTNASGATWSTSGTGSFFPNASALNATYDPNGDVGDIELILRSTGNGTCRPVRDTLILTITPAPTVDAGDDISLCSDFEGLQLNGQITIANGGVWNSSGTGSFAPDSTAPDAIYYASDEDRASGSVVLSLTTIGNGNCNAVSDQFVLSITPEPVLSAGPDRIACINADSVQLSGQVTNAGGVFWETFGSGTFLPDENALDAVYQPSAADFAADSVLLRVTATGTGVCNPINDLMWVRFVASPTISAGPDKIVCSNDFPVSLEGSGASGEWSGGNGTFFPNRQSLDANYTPTAAELSSGSVEFIVTSINNGACPAVSDTVNISLQNGPQADAGADHTVCADTAGVTLSGTFSNATGVLWTAAGSGVFNPSDTAINTSYILSQEDLQDTSIVFTLTTTGNGVCNPSSSRVTVFIKNPVPDANAGFDQVICEDEDSVQLRGSITVATGAVWTSVNGGTFLPSDTVLRPVYQPGATDVSNGNATIIITTTGNGICKPVRDTMQIDLLPVPVATPGADINVCADTSGIPLSGSVANAGGGIWSTSGTGIFSPDAEDLNAEYIPSAIDTLDGTITLYLETTNNGICSAERDSLNLLIDPAPVVDAGFDQIICADNDTINLTGQIFNASGGIWSANGSGSFVDNSLLNAQYIPSSTDKNNGQVRFTLSSTGNGLCRPVSDQVNVNIEPSPVVNAGSDRFICSDFDQINLSGSYSVAGGAVWSSVNGGGSFSPSTTTNDVVYTPVDTDRAQDTIKFLYTTTDNGLCQAVVDTANLILTPVPTVDAGPDLFVCKNENSVPLTGSVTVATGGAWFVNGLGSFTPNANSINAVYTPDDFERNRDSTYITLTSTGNGTCKSYTDTANVYFQDIPVVNAGIDQDVCVDVNAVSLNGSVLNATGGIWSTSGTGSFDDSTSLSAQYFPSDNDRSNGVVVLTLTSSGNASCEPVTDRVTLNITPRPQVNAGPDRIVCADVGSVSLNGLAPAGSRVLWRTTGSGTFSPTPQNGGSSYIPSAEDISNGGTQLVFENIDRGTCNRLLDTTNLTITPAPEVINPGPTICGDINTGVQLNGSVNNAGGGVWSSSGGGYFAPTAFSLTPKYYPSQSDVNQGQITITLTSTDNGTCNPVSVDVNVLIRKLPQPNAGPDKIICRGDSIGLVGNLNFNVDYQWETIAGAIISETNLANVVADNDTTFLYSMTDYLGCKVIDTAEVFVIDPPDFNLPDEACIRENLILDAGPVNIPPVNGTYQWFRNDSIQYLENGTTLAVEQIGLHMISYNFEFCTVYDSTLVNPLPVLDGNDRIACEGGTVSIETISLPGASYDWFHDPSETNFQTTINVNHAANTDSVFYVAVSDTNTCQSTDTITVTSISEPLIDLQPTPTCINDTMYLDGQPVNLSRTDAIYTWYLDNTELAEKDSVYGATLAGEYIVEYVVDACIQSDTVTVDFLPRPVTLNADYLNICDPTLLIDAGPGFSYEWITTGDTTRQIEVTETADYIVDVFNEAGCPTRDTIEVGDICPPEVYIPSGISPNGDGRGDFLEIFGTHFINFEMTIYNRWGEIIYFTDDRDNPWDGFYRGKLMDPGVYQWVVTYEGDSERYRGPYRMEGSVTVVR